VLIRHGCCNDDGGEAAAENQNKSNLLQHWKTRIAEEYCSTAKP
jgi:hypothetical protein